MTAHPAKFSDVIISCIQDLLDEQQVQGLALDPFAGVGKAHLLKGVELWGIEIEPEWAAMHTRTVVANALHLPFPDGIFGCLVTSPTYGNRLADAHEARDGSRRHSYTHTLGRRLSPDNSGQLQWGPNYRRFHAKAWAECLRTLAPGALCVVNLSNHIRSKEEQFVVEWHLEWFLHHGCALIDVRKVPTRRLREGQNYLARVANEFVLALRAPTVRREQTCEHQCTCQRAQTGRISTAKAGLLTGPPTRSQQPRTH